jgi:hypothetical protein
MELAIMEVQDKQERLKLNGIHQLLMCTDGISLLAENVNTVKSNTERC